MCEVIELLSDLVDLVEITLDCLRANRQTEATVLSVVKRRIDRDFTLSSRHAKEAELHGRLAGRTRRERSVVEIDAKTDVFVANRLERFGFYDRTSPD